jgi:GNAT superfamily N-acetyltransferase
LAELFNLGFSDYLVPFQLDEAAFRGHIASNDIDLGWSRVALDEQPVALALIAHRESQAWVGGMGTAPSHRRRGLGERALGDGLTAAQGAGSRAVWLEVIEGNDRAIALYDKLGFETVRALVVWTLDASAPGRSPGPETPSSDIAEAREWIAAHRVDREPWQRADASVDRMLQGGAILKALTVTREQEKAAALIGRFSPDAVTVLQVAAADPDAATELLATAAAGRTLRLSNLPAESALAPVLDDLGARPEVTQLEMRLRL